MMKKRLLLIAALPLAVAVALGVLSILPSRHGVTRANFDRIETGMPKAEVVAIFGEKGQPWHGAPEVGKAMFWIASDGSFALVMFVDECVVIKQWDDSNETVLDKIRRWLHLH